ncbi:unnamed protein product [Urochloa humidicola]
MTSTQRSESANHMLKTYIPRAAPMHLFVSQYTRLVADREADEGREDHATKQVSQTLRVGVPIEAHACSVYTRNMFSRFSHELFRSGAFSCTPNEEKGSFTVSLIDTGNVPAVWQTDFNVFISEDRTTVLCECKLFEHMGMPCRHVLKVLVQMGAKKIPPCLVLKRWTMEAKSTSGSSNGGGAQNSAPDLAALHSILYNAAMELVTLGRSSRQAFEVALNFVSKGKAAIASMTVIPRACSTAEAFDVEDSVQLDGSGVTSCQLKGVSAPPRVRSRGRPAHSRLKSPIESPGARKRKNSGDNQATGVQASSSIRTRSRCSFDQTMSSGSVMGGVQSRTEASGTDDLVSRSGKRTCQLCGEKGHYRSTCGRKSSYKAK